MSVAVTFLLLSHNRPRYLPQAVESVFAQTLAADCELLIVDDSTCGVVRAYLDTLGHPATRCPLGGGVQVVRVPPGTPLERKWNVGYELAEGPWIVPSCDDDLRGPTQAEAILRAAAQHPDAVLLSGDADHIDADGKKTAAGGRWPLYEDHGADGPPVMLHGAAVAFRADAARALRRDRDWQRGRPGSQVRGGSDWVFYRGLLAHAGGRHAFASLSGVLGKYRVHGAQITGG